MELEYPRFPAASSDETSRLRPDSPSEVGTPLEMTSFLTNYVIPSVVLASARTPANVVGRTCFGVEESRFGQHAVLVQLSEIQSLPWYGGRNPGILPVLGKGFTLRILRYAITPVIRRPLYLRSSQLTQRANTGLPERWRACLKLENKFKTLLPPVHPDRASTKTVQRVQPYIGIIKNGLLMLR